MSSRLAPWQMQHYSRLLPGIAKKAQDLSHADKQHRHKGYSGNIACSPIVPADVPAASLSAELKNTLQHLCHINNAP